MSRLNSAEIGPRSKGVPVVVVIAAGLALVVTAGFLGLTLTADRALESFRPGARSAEIGQPTAVGQGTEILSRGSSRSQVPSASPPATRSAPGPIFSGAIGEGIASAGIAILGLPLAVVAAAEALVELPEVQASGSSAGPVVQSGEDNGRRRSPVKRKGGQIADESDTIFSASGGPSSDGVDQGNDCGKRGNAHGSERQNDHDRNCPGNR